MSRPGELVSVDLEYQLAIKPRDGVFELRLPQIITQRFMPGTASCRPGGARLGKPDGDPRRERRGAGNQRPEPSAERSGGLRNQPEGGRGTRHGREPEPCADRATWRRGIREHRPAGPDRSRRPGLRTALASGGRRVSGRDVVSRGVERSPLLHGDGEPGPAGRGGGAAARPAHGGRHLEFHARRSAHPGEGGAAGGAERSAPGRPF